MLRLLVLLATVLVLSSQPALAQFFSQQGPKLVGTGENGLPRQGFSVWLSFDGNTAIVGGPFDNGNAGAVWVFVRSGSTWTQQGSKLVGAGAGETTPQGGSAGALAGDDNAIIS